MAKNNINFVVMAALCLSSSALYAQTTIKGKVVDNNNNPIQGATVTETTSKKQVQTDANGVFELPATGTSSSIQVQYIGFDSKTVQANPTGLTTIQLLPSTALLDEVVVTALNISKEKKTLGYSIQELKGKDLSEAKESNLVNSLAGKVAGVQVTNSQGNMGSSRIIIRGETSIAGNNQPLFVIDGTPVDNSQLGTSGNRDYANAISDINSEDIESISVLKGPNAAALYGSRAAAGVILITTKSGKKRKGLGININSNNTIERLAVLPDYQNVFGQGADGKFSYVDGKGGGINDGVDESWGPKMDGRLIPQFYSHGEAVPFLPHPDNVRSFFGTGRTLNNGISIADATDKVDYRFSYNNSNQTGIIPNSSIEKNNFNINTRYKITEDLTLTANANYVRTNSGNLPGVGGFRSNGYMLQFTWFGRQVDVSRLKNYRDENGNLVNWNNSYYSNPYFIAEENTVQQQRDRIFGNVGLNYKINEFLTANFRTGNDYYTDRRKIRVAYGTNGTPYGSYEEDAYTVNENNTEFTLNYNRPLSTDFTLDILAGSNIRSQSRQRNNQKAPRLAVPEVYTLANSRDALISTGEYSPLKAYSIFSSAQLGYKNYAFLNLTARNDWSSTLPVDNLSYFYPSANASIVLTDAFPIQSDILSFWKLRGGWSKVGKDTDPFSLIDSYLFSAPYGDNPQLSVNDIKKNPDLKPETTTSTELGTELAFLKNRVRLDLSLYDINSINQILAVDVSPSTGYKKKLMNAGKINNKGLEIQLGVTPVKKQDFQWDINVNFATNKSKVVELDNDGLLQSYTIGSSGTVQVLAAVGRPYGTLYGTGFLRNESGRLIVNADGTPATDPVNHYFGKFTPDWLGGITNQFRYKNFDLSFLIDIKHGGKLYSGTNATGRGTGVLASTLPGRDAEHGGLSYTVNGTTYDDGIIVDGVNADGSENTKVVSAQQYYKTLYRTNEANVFDASYVKLREAKLGYQLPNHWISKIGFQGASFSLVARNLWIIHKNAPNIDPETAFNTGNAQGLESLQLPTTRSFGFNLNLKF